MAHMNSEGIQLRILHLSDLQVGHPYLPEAADDLVELVRESSPTVVVISGDITQRAKGREYRTARRLLDRFGHLPVVAVPGNHDVPLYRIWERLVCPWRKWKHRMGPLQSVLRIPTTPGSMKNPDRYPDFRFLVLVGLPTAAPRRAIVNGRLSKAELAFAEQAFAATPERSLRVLVVHHLITEPPGSPGGRSAHPLPGAHHLQERIKGMGVELVLAGHVHFGFEQAVGEDGECLVVHAGTATSSRGRGPETGINTVNIVDLLHGGELRITRMARAAGSSGFTRRSRRSWQLRARRG